MSEEDDTPDEDENPLLAVTEELGPTLVKADENPVAKWFLLTGNRIRVTAVLLVTVFVALVVLSMIRPVDMQELVNETAAARTLFSSLLGGAILLVSIVVSINSTALSQEITDIEGQQERIGAAVEYRRGIEELIERDVSPTQPSEFLTAILGAIARETQALADAASDSPNEEFTQNVDRFVDEVGDDLEVARGRLHNASLGSFQVLLAGLNYDYTGQLYAARRFEREFEEAIDDEEQEVIENLVETLEFFATGREYFKSLYYERELARLSSRLLYISLPVIVFTSYVLLAVDGDVVPEMSVYRLTSLQLFISFAYTVALAPYIILTAYIVRLSTVTLRTLAAGPFIFQQQSDIDVFDRDTSEETYAWDLPEENE